MLRCARLSMKICHKNVPIEPTFLKRVRLDNQDRIRHRQTVYVYEITPLIRIREFKTLTSINYSDKIRRINNKSQLR